MVPEVYCLELLDSVTGQGHNASDPHKNKTMGYKLYNMNTKLGHQMRHLGWADKDSDVLNTAFVVPHTQLPPVSHTNKGYRNFNNKNEKENWCVRSKI